MHVNMRLTFDLCEVCSLFHRAALAGNGTAIQSCTMVGVGNTTEFTLTLMLDDCDDFGTEPQYGEREGGREGGRGGREGGKMV